MAVSRSVCLYYLAIYYVCYYALFFSTSISMSVTTPGSLSAETGRTCHFELARRRSNCSHRGLKEVPGNIPANTLTLSLSYNTLRVLTNRSFYGLTELVAISLQKNSIYQIDVGTFAGLPRLNAVNLISNLLQYLPGKLFAKNIHLSDVFLRDNLFESVPALHLGAHENLSAIDLAENNIVLARINIILPPKCQLVLVDLGSNNISTIREGDLSNLQLCTEIERVDFSFNEIKSVEQKCIDGYPIKGITFEANPLHERGVREVIDAVALAPNLTYLVVSGAQLTNLSQDLFTNLEMSSVTKISMSSNNIPKLDRSGDTFHYLSRIRSFSLVNNSIKEVAPGPFRSMSSLLYLFLESCKLYEIIAPARGERWKPPLELLSLANNFISEIPSRAFVGLGVLLYIDLQYNSIQVIHGDSFHGLNGLEILVLNNNNLINTLSSFVFGSLGSLASLDVSDSNVNSLEPSVSFHGMTALRELYLQNNPIHSSDIWDNEIGVSLFEGLHQLRSIDLSSTFIRNEIPMKCFRGLYNLSQLNLQGMSSIKKIHPDLLQDLVHLQIFSIDDNDIQDFPSNIFRNQLQLSALYMSRNPVSHMDPNLFEHLHKLKQLSLAGTNVQIIQEDLLRPIAMSIETLDISHKSLACNCDNQWFKKWLRKSETNVIQTGTVCADDSSKEMRGRPFQEFDSDVECGPRVLVYTCVALASVLLLVLLTLMYFNRWWINYKCFLFKLCIIGYEEIVDDKDYQFDINIVFHDTDEEWVVDKLLPKIREEDPDAVLCVGDDDLPLGMQRLDAVAEAIDDSYKSVFVLSHAAISDGWFIIKLRLALQHINHEQRDAVLLVFLEDIEDNRLPYLVRLLLSVNRPHLYWSPDPRCHDYFWAQFSKSVKITTKIDQTLPV